VRKAWDRYGDVAIAALLSIAVLWEAAAERGDRPIVLGLLATVPLVERRRRPLAVLAAVALGAAISREAPYVVIGCAALAAYSVGAHSRWWWLALAELIVIAVFVVITFGGALPPIPDWSGPFAVLLPLWLVGFAIRQERARTAGLAERAQRLEREQELAARAAQADERARIARELHDVVAHSVSVMVVQAGAAREVLKQSPEKALAALTAVEETGREAMRELRQTLDVLGAGDGGLAPQPTLDQVPALVAAVQQAGLPVDLDVVGERRPLPAGVELTAYRVIQEALTNAVKHSGLAPTRVAIDYRPDELKLEVLCDCEVAEPAGSTGRGLAGMRERVAQAGGRLEAGPGVERGYNVRAWLPA